MANISVTGGTLVSDIPVQKERQKVVETISAVNENNVSVKRGTLAMKRVREMVDVIQGGIEAMNQPKTEPEPEKTPFDPDREFSQSFRTDVTPPPETKTAQVSGMAAPQAGQAATPPQPISSPQFKTTESPSVSRPEAEERPTIGQLPPIEERPEVEVTELPDTTAASGVQPTDGKVETEQEPVLQAEEPPAIVDEEVVSEPEATYVTNMFDSLKDVEGEKSHVDGRGYFTMAYGVVPDADSVTKADGTKFDPRGTHGFTTDTAGTVDVSKATHTLEVDENTSYTLKRVDYNSDKEFAKAVVDLYDRETAKKYGEGWDDLPDSSKRMALDLAWNGGVNAVGWSSVQTAMKEAAKDNPSTENLFGFTVNFRSGTQYPRGLFKRRLIQYNLIANEADKAATYSTEAVNDAQGKRIGTKYIANRSDGTVIGSWSYTDKPEDPNTKKIELRTPSTEIIEANVPVQ